MIGIINLVIVLTELLVNNLLIDIRFWGIDGLEAIGKHCLEIILLLSKDFNRLKHTIGSSSWAELFSGSWIYKRGILRIVRSGYRLFISFEWSQGLLKPIDRLRQWSQSLRFINTVFWSELTLVCWKCYSCVISLLLELNLGA